MRTYLDPKKSFLASGLTENHNNLVESPQVRASVEYAFAQFCTNSHSGPLTNKAEAFAQIEGARGFINTWLNLGRPPEPEKEDSRQLKPIPNRL
jgi:hypothetical protein